MTLDIKKVAVLGSGVMGSGIAAQIANAGIPVFLLDMPSENKQRKSSLAEDAIERMRTAEPAPFMSSHAIKYVTPGNFEDDLGKVKECDWVIEVIVEKLDAKQQLYAKLEKFIKPGTLISSNTSTIPLHQLTQGRSENFQKNFAITHFFNPPRYMRLLEMVSGPKTSPETVAALEDFCDIKLGKSIVHCHDTPGFIGNRIGTFWLQTAMLTAIEMKISVEEADAVFGRPLGIPKTGVFGLMDLVGLDLIPLIGQSMKASLPPDDAYCTHYHESDVLKKMIAEGYTGRKGKGGFYRLNKEGNTKIKESIDLQTGEYHPSFPVKLPELNPPDHVRALLLLPDRLGQYAWKVLSAVLCYAASIASEISDHIAGIDTAIKLGYNWKYGPFELMDKIGASWIAEKLRKDSVLVPSLLEKVGENTFNRVYNGRLQYFTFKGTYEDIPRRPGQLLLSDIKLYSSPILHNGSASLWDIGDSVACLEFHSKMNTIDPDIMAMIRQSIDEVGKNFKALVIYNEGTNFSAGANIGLALFTANVALWSLIHQIISEGQQTYKALKYASFPVVSAPSGLALGGGCEILLHSTAIQAHAESYLGLVEVGVGLIPAWGGCKELLNRWITHHQRPGGAVSALAKVFDIIGMAKVAKSAEEAREFLYLSPEDGVTMNRDRLLADAKSKALSLVRNYKPPEPVSLSLPGRTAKMALMMAVKALVKVGKASVYDEEISQKLAFVVTGGSADITEKQTEDQLYALELDAFMMLIKKPETLARIEHMLETGKPLRN